MIASLLKFEMKGWFGIMLLMTILCRYRQELAHELLCCPTQYMRDQ